MTERRIFISYNQKDGEVARMLDASLQVAGARTFLDQRDILVGDSITQEVYRGLESSTDLLYLISANSAGSKWVAEELTVAKTRQRSQDGYRILPVLIDDTQPPLGIAHLRYADLREWRDPQVYRREMLELLRSLGMEPLLSDHRQVSWWITNRSRMQPHRELIQEAYHLLDTALSYQQYFDNTWDRGPHYWAWKISFGDIGVDTQCSALARLIATLHDAGRRSGPIIQAAQAVNEVRRRRFYSEAAVREVCDHLGLILGALRDLDAEAMTVVGATIGADPLPEGGPAAL
ncbi:toll/interleukin-1 receptor domain-containing protein [Streptomyces sp. NPDC058676]|uniref:toll/interleukin-1 receptor domain-containing protein n=1 Tax=unclassified Streptomyces TaxID=2593676 RepID=UPI00365894D2